MEGVEVLLGQKAAVPGIGARVSIDPQAGDSPRPSYFVLIDASNTRHNEVWIRENQLLKGASLAAAVPYQDDDFVLYSRVHAGDGKHALRQPPVSILPIALPVQPILAEVEMALSRLEPRGECIANDAPRPPPGSLSIPVRFAVASVFSTDLAFLPRARRVTFQAIVIFFTLQFLDRFFRGALDTKSSNILLVRRIRWR